MTVRIEDTNTIHEERIRLLIEIDRLRLIRRFMRSSTVRRPHESAPERVMSGSCKGNHTPLAT